MKPVVALILLGCVFSAKGGWRADPPYYGQQYSAAPSARALWVDPAGDLLILSRPNVQVVYETDNGDGTIDVVQQRLVTGQPFGLNHGLTYHNGFIYASSPTMVYRWPYTPGNRTQINVGEEVVISGIPGGGHNTRTVIFDNQGRLYVSVGSQGNVDNDSSRSRIRRFNMTGVTFPIAFNNGEVFADGLRNEVGLAFDLNGVLHGVENGADNLNRPDMGGDIHNGNPSEEMNRFDLGVGAHYGYPYCWTVYNLTGQSPGSQFAWPSFMGDGIHNDVWCKTVQNNRMPFIPMPAHHAPLGIDFFRGQMCNSTGAFPCNFTGHAVVAFHGSWNSNIPVGYRVSRFPIVNQGSPTFEDINIIYEENVTRCYTQQCFRPVNAVINNNGHLLVSDDSGGVIIKVTYGTPPKPIRKYIDRSM